MVGVKVINGHIWLITGFYETLLTVDDVPKLIKDLGNALFTQREWKNRWTETVARLSIDWSASIVFW